MLLHALGVMLFLGAGIVGIAAMVSSFRSAMMALRAEASAGGPARAASLEARPLPSIEPLPAAVIEEPAPTGQPVRLRRQRRLRRQSSLGTASSWWMRPPLRLPQPAFAAAGAHSYAR